MVERMVRKASAPPVKKTVAKKRAPSKKVREAAALKWSRTHGAPIMVLSGWDPKMGEWAKGSPVGDMLIDMREDGLHMAAAARRHDVRRITELVSKGYDYMSDEGISEDRLLIPVDQRVFVDLALQVQFAEGEAEHGPVKVLFKAALDSPRDALAYLARRFPERWRDQPDAALVLEKDPRDVAVDQLLQDPNMAMKLGVIARKAAELAASADPDAS
jgi:hypothetical protein